MQFSLLALVTQWSSDPVDTDYFADCVGAEILSSSLDNTGAVQCCHLLDTQGYIGPTKFFSLDWGYLTLISWLYKSIWSFIVLFEFKGLLETGKLKSSSEWWWYLCEVVPATFHFLGHWAHEKSPNVVSALLSHFRSPFLIFLKDEPLFFYNIHSSWRSLF